MSKSKALEPGKEPSRQRKYARNPGARAKSLGISYEERHRQHVIRLLAEMYKPAEVVALTIQEYALEWRIEDPRAPGARERLEEIQAWLYARVKSYSYDKARGKIQDQIRNMREEIRHDLEEHYRGANKFSRIQDLERIKDMAMKDAQYMAAVRALQAMREELEGTHIRLDGKIEHRHRFVTPESEIDEELKRLLTEDIGVTGDRADRFVRAISQTAGALPHPAKAQPRKVESGPD